MKNVNAPTVTPEQFQGWGKLEPNEQDAVKRESLELFESRKLESKSKLEQGQHLSALRDILEPKRIFTSFLQDIFHMSKATAYRYMEAYEVTRSKVSAPVLEIALARGTKISPKMLAANPPPKTTNRAKIEVYLDTLKPGRIDAPVSAETLLKECVNFVSLRWDRLPSNHKTRAAFMRSLIGMLMARFGVASDQSFSPTAIPDSFRVVRGRPKGVKKAA